MRIKSIAAHLRPYLMLARRRTTINHAFAAAIAPSDTYDEATVAEAMRSLGFEPASDLPCVYCESPAETWDHIHATVKGSQFSGHGHRLGNLLPCCKPCNSKKGNKSWREHLYSLAIPASERVARIARIEAYLDRYAVVDQPPQNTDDLRRLNEIREKILDLLAEDDSIAARIRKQ